MDSSRIYMVDVRRDPKSVGEKILTALDSSKGSWTVTARRLGVGTSTLSEWRKYIAEKVRSFDARARRIIDKHADTILASFVEAGSRGGQPTHRVNG